MPDLLTHVLAGYILATILSFHYDWLTPGYVSIAMLGALVPDFTKIRLLIPSDVMAAVLGFPFDWFAIHALGGALVAIAIGSLLTGSKQRKQVFGLLLLGALSHLFLDGLLLNLSGHSFAVFWPLTTYHPPTPGLYLSSDRWPAAVAALVAVAVWSLRYRRR